MSSITAGGSPAGTIKAAVHSAPRSRALSLGLTAYHAGSSGSQELAGWHPHLRSPDAEVLPARNKVVARSRDLDRNNGWIQGAVNKKADAIVGSNIRLRARPDFAAMGMSAEWADEWALKVEALWRVWANDPRMTCDVERQSGFGPMVRVAYMHWLLDGEAALAVYFLPDRGSMMATALLVVDPDRISNPNGRADGKGLDGVDLRGGVELDQYGAARAYWVRNGHPGDVGVNWDSQTWTRIPREKSTGCPMFIHAVNRRRAHQHRSVGVLSPNMGRAKNVDTYERYELGAALRNQSYGMYVESPYDSEFVREALAPAGDGGPEDVAELSQYQDLRLAYHERTDVSLSGVPLAHLAPGEKIVTVAPSNPTTNFEPFTSFQLGAISSPIGLASEQVTGRWAGVNYSNARMIVNETDRGWRSERFTFTQALCTPAYAAWLEEQVARDLVEVPGGKANFYVFRSALCRAEWIGPARGSIDKLKEGKGDEIDRDGFVSTLETQCAERGLDWRDVLWQAKRELEEKRRYGLIPEEVATGGAGGGNDANQPDAAANNDAADARETAGGDA